MCLERNYTDTVMSSPYADNFLAPAANMPDDPDVDKLPEETQRELAKVSLSLELDHSTAALKSRRFQILMLSVSPTAVFCESSRTSSHLFLSGSLSSPLLGFSGFPVFPLVLVRSCLPLCLKVSIPDLRSLIFAMQYVMIWASSLVARFFLLKSKAFRKLNVSTERTTTTYPVSILWTTIALVLQFVAAPSMFGYYSLLGIGAIRLAGVIIVALCQSPFFSRCITGLELISASSLVLTDTFELIYRHSIRPPLLIHHLLTIFSICFVVICASTRLRSLPGQRSLTVALLCFPSLQALRSPLTRPSSRPLASGCSRPHSSRASSSVSLPVRLPLPLTSTLYIR